MTKLKKRKKLSGFIPHPQCSVSKQGYEWYKTRNKSPQDPKRKFVGAGFTLVEILLYIAITGIILMSVSFFLSLLLESRVKNQTIAEVEQSGVQVMQIIQQTARDSKLINSPVAGSSAPSCSLAIGDSAKNPTVYDLSSGSIRVKEGTGQAINLTSDRLSASDLLFSNLSRGEVGGILRIQFTLTHKNPGGRNEYDYSKTFYGSASLR